MLPILFLGNKKPRFDGIVDVLYTPQWQSQERELGKKGGPKECLYEDVALIRVFLLSIRYGKGYNGVTMREMITRALVLSRDPFGEGDALLRLFSEDFGRINAWSKSLTKITSKLSGHLQPLHFVQVRMVDSLKGGGALYRIVDGMADVSMISYRSHERYDLLPLLRVLEHIAPEHEPDDRVWAFLEGVVQKKYEAQGSLALLLSLWGFDQRHASCAWCGAIAIEGFHIHEGVFLCHACASKLSPDAVVLL